MQAHSTGPNAESFHPSSWWILFNRNQLEEAELAGFYWIGRNMLSDILSPVVQQSICVILTFCFVLSVILLLVLIPQQHPGWCLYI